MFVHHRIVTAVTILEFVSDRVSHTVLRSRWCNFTVPNVHTQSEKKNDDSKDSFFKELEQVFFCQLPKYHLKILLGHFIAKVGRENIFKPTVGNDSLHQVSKDNVFGIVNFVSSKL